MFTENTARIVWNGQLRIWSIHTSIPIPTFSWPNSVMIPANFFGIHGDELGPLTVAALQSNEYS